MKAKRILSALLAALMLIGVCMTGVAVSAEGDLPFTDVKKNWSYEPIKYVYEAGLMNGTGDGTKFSPEMSLSRGMVVTVLYRNSGSPATEFTDTFLDVADGKYYSVAAVWAFENGIVNGTGTDEWGDPYFSPDNTITRQELATMFSRYAAYKHVDVTADTADISSFPDSANVAGWAKDAVKWAVGTGLITGKSNGGKTTLAPKDYASRAEFAAIVYRFNTLDFEYELYYSEPMPISSYTEKPYPLVNDADIYVAVDGDDNNPGTIEAPLATFEAAKLKVRELKKTAKDEIVVAFKAGNYGILDNIQFNEEDSGTADVPVTYCKYGDGDVVFQNGITIPSGDFVKVDESDYYLLGEVDTSKIYKADLTGKIDSFTGKNILFSETSICHEARIPNKRNSSIEHAYWNVTTTHDEHSSILLQGYLPGIVESFRTTEGMKVTGMLRTGWLVDTFPVKSYDPETDILSFDFEDPTAFSNGYYLDEYPLAYEGRMDDYLYFHNLSDQIDNDGEYWFNPEAKMLYIYDPEGDYFISQSGTFMTINQYAEYLSFIGLNFSTTTDTAIYIASKNLTFDNCKMGNVAGHAVIDNIDGYNIYNFTLTNSELYNFVDTGVEIDSYLHDMYALKPTGIVIENNYFHDFSLPQYWAHGIQLTECVGSIIAHNEFKNGAHAAIRYNSCIDTVIEYNIFDNMMNATQDYGAIYSFREIICRSNIIRYNLFKNGGIYGVYIDGSYGQEFYGNIFYNEGVRNFVTNGGRDNIIRDNITIATSGYNGSFITYNSDLTAVDENGNFTTEIEEKLTMTHHKLNELPAKGTENYEKWYERWPLLYDYDLNFENVGEYDCIYTTVNHIWDNSLFGVNIETEGAIITPFGDLKNNVSYSTEENDFFVDPTHGDYTIVDGADIFDIQFEKIGRY